LRSGPDRSPKRFRAAAFQAALLSGGGSLRHRLRARAAIVADDCEKSGPNSPL
jgi:hypothetical protein